MSHLSTEIWGSVGIVSRGLSVLQAFLSKLLGKPTLSLFRQSISIAPYSAMEYYAPSEIQISIKNKLHGILAALVMLEHPKEVAILLIRTHAQFSTYPLSITFSLTMVFLL